MNFESLKLAILTQTSVAITGFPEMNGKGATILSLLQLQLGIPGEAIPPDLFCKHLNFFFLSVFSSHLIMELLCTYSSFCNPYMQLIRVFCKLAIFTLSLVCPVFLELHA